MYKKFKEKLHYGQKTDSQWWNTLSLHNMSHEILMENFILGKVRKWLILVKNPFAWTFCHKIFKEKLHFGKTETDSHKWKNLLEPFVTRNSKGKKGLKHRHTSLEFQSPEKKSAKRLDGTTKFFGSNAKFWYLKLKKVTSRFWENRNQSYTMNLC